MNKIRVRGWCYLYNDEVWEVTLQQKKHARDVKEHQCTIILDGDQTFVKIDGFLRNRIIDGQALDNLKCELNHK